MAITSPIDNFSDCAAAAAAALLFHDQNLAERKSERERERANGERTSDNELTAGEQRKEGEGVKER